MHKTNRKVEKSKFRREQQRACRKVTNSGRGTVGDKLYKNALHVTYKGY